MSKELVTIRTDLPVTLDLDALRTEQPNTAQLRQLFIELEFTSLLKDLDVPAPVAVEARAPTNYVVVDTVQAMEAMVARARAVGSITFDTETGPEPGAPTKIDALRSRLVSLSVALAPGEAYYLPLAHREYRPAQGELQMAGASTDGDEPTDAEPDSPNADGGPTNEPPSGLRQRRRAECVGGSESIAARMLATGRFVPTNLPSLDAPEMAPLRALLEDATISKTAQNAKYDILVLRMRGSRCAAWSSTRCSPATCSTRAGVPTAWTCSPWSS